MQVENTEINGFLIDKFNQYGLEEGFVRDGRIGHSHMSVPGPDGKFGFGGSCFPKDIQAMINFAESLDVYPEVLLGAWNKNLEVRPEEDWKKLKGRAVVEEKA